jgi:16S rRNA (guanine527-N7)-methyltransferase
MKEPAMEIMGKALDFYEIAGANEKMEKIAVYSEMLVKNRKWAGLASRSFEGTMEESMMDSMMVLEGTVSRKSQVADIGSGGGLLGIVLAIACPMMNVTMVESSGRKSAFLAEVSGALALENVEIANVRAEQMVGNREFDVCVSRASGRLDEIATLAIRLLAKEGRYVALKSRDIQAEVEKARPAVEKAGGKITVVKPRMPAALGMQSRASLVVVDKL